MLSIIPWKPLAFVGALIALVLLGWGLRVDHLRAGWKDRYTTLHEEAQTVVIAVRHASGNGKVQWDTTPGQIVAMGETLTALRASVATQNKAIDEMAAEAVRLKAKASEMQELARKAEAQRASALKRLSDLKAAPAVKRDCLQLVEEANAALDLIRKEGF